MIPPFNNILLAFQLENYKNIRFLRFIYTHPKFWLKGSKRQTLEYTHKAKLILTLSVIFCVFDIVASLYFMSGIPLWISLIAVILALPLYFVASNIIITPLDTYLKKRIIKNAQTKIRNFPHLKVIAITGSYGKTTTKEILGTILSENYSVLMTEGTKNTPLGISRLISKELTDKHDVFIVEMGAYEKGDIKELCGIVQPNISILTGITLQHLERFKSLDNIIDAKFEILEYLGETDFAVIDVSTEAVKKGLSEKQLKVTQIETVEKGLPYSYKPDLGGISFHIDGEKYETKLLASYVLQTIEICYKVSQKLGMPLDNFKAGVAKIDFVEHRMELIHNNASNIYVIDDSFNGNLEGVESILDLMKHAPFSGRKILVAGGVVELGDKTDEVHHKLGRQISPVADMVLLIDGPVGNALKKGLSEAGYKPTDMKVYKTPLELHEDLKNIIQNGDMVVFQNDLPDQYL